MHRIRKRVGFVYIHTRYRRQRLKYLAAVFAGDYNRAYPFFDYRRKRCVVKSLASATEYKRQRLAV